MIDHSAITWVYTRAADVIPRYSTQDPDAEPVVTCLADVITGVACPRTGGIAYGVRPGDEPWFPRVLEGTSPTKVAWRIRHQTTREALPEDQTVVYVLCRGWCHDVRVRYVGLSRHLRSRLRAHAYKMAVGKGITIHAVYYWNVASPHIAAAVEAQLIALLAPGWNRSLGNCQPGVYARQEEVWGLSQAGYDCKAIAVSEGLTPQGVANILAAQRIVERVRWNIYGTGAPVVLRSA